MLKSLFSIIVVVVLLVSNWGLTVSTHYCHGHYQGHSVTWFAESSSCSMPNQSQCCHSHADYLKANVDLLLSKYPHGAVDKIFGKILSGLEVPFFAFRSLQAHNLVSKIQGTSLPYVSVPAWKLLSVYLS